MRASSALCGLKAAMMERYAFAAKCFNKHEQRRIVMKILVMGAGAVGNYFGARLQQAGEDVIFCARGQNLRILCEKGLEIQSPRGDVAIRVKATADPREFAPYDLILFCVKAYDTEAAARAIDGCLNAGGAVLTLQNGVESEARLCEILGKDSVMGGNARVGAEVVEPGKVLHRTNGVIEFGEIDGHDTARARKLAEMFQRAGRRHGIKTPYAETVYSLLKLVDQNIRRKMS